MAPKAPYLASAAILYNSRGRKPGARPGGVSRSRTEPWQPRAKGPAAGSTLTPVRACQPSGISESTAPVPIPTAPKGAIDLTALFCGEISPLRFAPVEMTMGRPPAVPIPHARQDLSIKKAPPRRAVLFYFSFSSSVGAGSFWTKSRVPWISWSFTSSASAAVQYVPSLLVRAA